MNHINIKECLRICDQIIRYVYALRPCHNNMSGNIILVSGKFYSDSVESVDVECNYLLTIMEKFMIYKGVRVTPIVYEKSYDTLVKNNREITILNACIEVTITYVENDI